jgi:lysophospholipase L1-like esterase
MKRLLIIPLVLILFSMAPIKKVKIIFFGDSITQQGIKAGGYINRIQSTLKANGLDEKYELIGAGIGGNKVYDLYLRMDKDVMAKEPDVVVIFIGINDVWHKSRGGTGTDVDKYEKFYVAIIEKLQAKKIKVALCTLTVIGEMKNGANPQDGDLEKYSEVVRKLASQYGCTLIELRKSFSEYENTHNSENKESGILTTDRVHLNANGNQLVAEEMEKGLSLQ